MSDESKCSIVNGRVTPVYTDDPAANAMMDFMDERVDEWMKETSIVSATHGMVAVFARFASREILGRFRQQVEAHMRLSFVEGAFRSWEEISEQQRIIGRPLPPYGTRHDALPAVTRTFTKVDVEAVATAITMQLRLEWKQRAVAINPRSITCAAHAALSAIGEVEG